MIVYKIYPEEGKDINELMEELQKNERVKSIKKEPIAFGLEVIKIGVVMDDKKDQPEEIEKFYNKALEGYDSVVGIRKDRQDKLLKRITSKLFYVVFNFLTNQNIDNRTSIRDSSFNTFRNKFSFG